ncbi:MAG: hypothetical protein A2603_14105 [Bdellovibrionales bacterium RIFOXYD1_FULL_55_31]|nr:MAG: hypothetical protein A2603_14105 [Bdellovibrionales bacterium RIFOXYD1_FULL_55_31]
MKQFGFISVVSIAAMVLSLPSFAGVKFFQPGKAPVIIETVSMAADNVEAAKNVVFNFVATHPEIFPLHPSDQSLYLKRAEPTPRGLVLHFEQRVLGVGVEGAEIVALFNSKQELESVNSSVAPVAMLSAKPTISRGEAFKVAVRELGFQSAELGQENSDGLRIIQTAEGAVLVWQFSIREGLDGSGASRTQVIASGPNAGKLLKSLPVSDAAAKPGAIDIYDASVTILIPNPIYKGVKVLHNGKRWGLGVFEISKEPKKANASFEKVRDFYQKIFNRFSFDGKGAPIVASVNVQRAFRTLDLLKLRENAAWIGPWKTFALGAGGRSLGNFSESLDVIGHEFTHAVVSTTAELTPGGRPGALNEHLADVFGAAIEQYYEHPANPFLMGEKCLRGALAKKSEALRDMLNPQKSLGGQPAHMREIPDEYGPACTPTQKNDSCGVHDLNGILNRAVALMIQQLGWEPIQKLVYQVMVGRLRSSSDFEDYRNQVVEECNATLSANACDVVRTAFADVGL